MMAPQTITSTVPVVNLAQERRIELKYGLILAGLLVAMVFLSNTAPVMMMEQWTNGFMQSFVAMGAIGVFIFSFIANAAYMVNIPYTILMLVVAATTTSLTDQLLLGVITGLGAALGASVSYMAVHKMANPPASEPENGFAAKLEQLIRNHPRLAPAVVFAGALTPLPDDPIFVYLALNRYPLRKLLVPLFTGKVIHALTLIALLGLFNPGQLEVGFNSIFPLLVLAIVFARYQSEKSNS